MSGEIWILLAAVAGTVVAAFLIVGLGGFLRGRTEFGDQSVPDTVVLAEVVQKYITETRSSDRPMACVAAFRCRDGKDVFLQVDAATYAALQEGQQGELVYRDKLFLGFGEPTGASESVVQDEYTYTYTDFDERIDRELPADFDLSQAAAADSGTASREHALHLQYLSGRRLPPQLFHMRGEMDSFESYPPLRLLSRSEIPAFLKKESRLQNLFETVYVQSLHDLQNKAGDRRGGLASGKTELQGSVFTLELALQEYPRPYRHQVAARLVVNMKVVEPRSQ